MNGTGNPEPEYRGCFACGTDNPRGIHLEPRNENGEAVAVFIPDATLEGYHGVTHGGLTATVLDEIMVWSARFAADAAAVTGEMTVRYLKPVSTGVRHTARGRVTENKGRLIRTEGTLEDGDGVIVARAQAKLFVVSREPGEKKSSE
ncbi:MAG: PaaI family thioesterase [bacterium]|nr:PaaI family thioesterase [bacterium]